MKRIICHIACDSSGLNLMVLEIPSNFVLLYEPSQYCFCCLNRDFLVLCSKFWLKYCSLQQHIIYLKSRQTAILQKQPAKKVFGYKFSGIFQQWLIENTCVSIAFSPSRLSSFKNVPCRCSC